MIMPTPHIECEKGMISKMVIMPGDPLRSKFIAEHFLTDVKMVNKIRNCLAYTGKYKGKEVTIFSSGMGIPSMGIYAYELYKFYDVEKIIRVGSCGTFKEDIHLFDLILASSSVSESTFGQVFSGNKEEQVYGSSTLNQKIKEVGKSLNKSIYEGNVYCSEAFYSMMEEKSPLIEKYQCLSVEMESFALFHIANALHKEASCLLTVSDSMVTNEETSSEEREKGFTDMIEVALESILF